MSSESPTRRLTRSQTSSSVLGKRSSSFAVPSSAASIRPKRLPTPDPTPNAKKARTSFESYDPRANKENIPPFRNGLPESPSTQRSISRRSSFSSDISTISVSSRRSASSAYSFAVTYSLADMWFRPYFPDLRRHATQPVIPQTPTKAIDELTLASPPPTPQTSIPLSLRVRGLLRATSNSNHNLSFDGREEERVLIESFLTNFDDAGDAAEPVLFASGTPGTGKTALVNSIIASLNVDDNVKIIFLNCMSITGMDVLWARVSEELSTSMKKAGSSRRAAKKLNSRDEIAAFLEKQNNMKW